MADADGTRDIHVTAGTGGSFGSSSLQQEIGLGQASKIEALEIAWPTWPPTVQTFTNVPMDRVLRIREGKKPRVVKTKPLPMGRNVQAGGP